MLGLTTGSQSYDLVLAGGLLFACLIAVGSAFFPSPYGRFESKGMGPAIPPRLGWILMELPAPITFAIVWAQGSRHGVVPVFFLIVWLVHYANRGFVNPMLMRVRAGAGFSSGVVVFGWIVTVLHAWLYAHWVAELGSHLSMEWLSDPRFLGGIVLYYGGFVLNVHSDALLRRLRDTREVADGADSYKIPHGGGFSLVSSPHYLGEILAWTGLALATWCPGGLFVWLVTVANLVPRALKTHRWYHERFPDYPPARKALIPFVL